MHISHVQSVQVYASVSFDTVLCMVAGAPLLGFRVRGSVLCARDVVTEMAVALHAIGAKCDVHHVAEKDAQRFGKAGPSVAQDRQRQPGVLQPSQSAAALSAAVRSVPDIALLALCVAVR